MKRLLLIAALAACVPAHAVLVMPLAGMAGCQQPTIALAADFGMGASYSGTQAGSPTSVVLTVKNDGTWTITFGAGDTPAGSPTSGTWAASTSAGVGNDYQVLYETSGAVNSPTITNNASTYTTVTGDITITVARAAANASANVTVSMRALNCPTNTLSDTANFAANGA